MIVTTEETSSSVTGLWYPPNYSNNIVSSEIFFNSTIEHNNYVINTTIERSSHHSCAGGWASWNNANCVSDTFEIRTRNLTDKSFVIEIQRTDTDIGFGVKLEIRWSMYFLGKI
jgi:hypothetical protein